MMNTFFSFRYRLFACFAFIGAMLLIRFAVSGNIRFVFLVWNLFLAWLPYLFSLLAFSETTKSRKMRFMFAGAWLAFFPNALYVITDIIHLRQTDNIPVWYDAVLLFLSASTGLMLAFASLLNAEKSLRRTVHGKYVQLIVVSLIFLGAFGVYIGRFLRWNSWSVMTHPLSLAGDIAQRFIHPLQHTRTWGITLFLTALYCFMWYLVKATMDSVKKQKPANSPASFSQKYSLEIES